MENQSKSLLQSKTFWGSAIAAGSMGLNFLGIDIGPEQQAALTKAAIDLAGIAGTLLAIFGRVTASQAIGRLF